MNRQQQESLLTHRDRAKQLIDFSHLKYGVFHPTDIDGVIEYKDMLYIFFEFKYQDAVFPVGQRLCLERLCNDAFKAGKQAIAIVARHSETDANIDVDAGRTRVDEVYYSGKWIKSKPMLAQTLVDNYIKLRFYTEDREMDKTTICRHYCEYCGKNTDKCKSCGDFMRNIKVSEEARELMAEKVIAPPAKLYEALVAQAIADFAVRTDEKKDGGAK